MSEPIHGHFVLASLGDLSVDDAVGNRRDRRRDGSRTDHVDAEEVVFGSEAVEVPVESGFGGGVGGGESDWELAGDGGRDDNVTGFFGDPVVGGHGQEGELDGGVKVEVEEVAGDLRGGVSAVLIMEKGALQSVQKDCCVFHMTGDLMALFEPLFALFEPLVARFEPNALFRTALLLASPAWASRGPVGAGSGRR